MTKWLGAVAHLIPQGWGGEAIGAVCNLASLVQETFTDQPDASFLLNITDTKHTIKDQSEVQRLAKLIKDLEVSSKPTERWDECLKCCGDEPGSFLYLCAKCGESKN